MVAGCSKDPTAVTPQNEPGSEPLASAATDDTSPYRVPWGFWDISLDRTGELEIVPLRNVQYTVNVNMYLQPPFGDIANMDAKIVNDDYLFTTGRVVMDVYLTHPFPANPEFSGFDVLGVFIHNGGRTAKLNSSVKYARTGTDAMLLNADGYTRWMNPVEFTESGLGGYTEGALGNKGNVWTATANPYRYFCNGLGTTESVADHYGSSASVSNRGVFRAGSKNTRRYVLKFPMSGGYPQIKFQYAVVASWIEPNHKPPTSIPEDFPDIANMVEPFFARMETDGSTCFFNSSTDKGGSLLLTLEIFDQGARTDPSKVAGQISQIIVESPGDFIQGSGNTITFTSSTWTTSPGTTQISQKFTLDCGVVNPLGPDPDDNPILVAIQSDVGTYNTGLGTPFPSGPLRMYQTFNVPMTDWDPDAPGNVANFEATDGEVSLNTHRVELTWDEVSDADEYEIQRREYDLDEESWSWEHLQTVLFGTTSYLDNDARYSGVNNQISYRIRAANAFGSSPAWSTDTGYPKMRRVGISFYCAADNTSGQNAVVPWSRATADFNDCNSFWNDYGYDFVMENSGEFYWMTNVTYRHLTGGEPSDMHDQFGKVSHPNSVNVYYVETSEGSYTKAYNVAICPGSQHNTQNTLIVFCQNARIACPPSQAIDIILAHECGHALTRFWDVYLMDLNGNGRMDDGTDCSINTWCNGPPPLTPVMYCDIDATYPEEPGSINKIPKNLMWYSYCGCPVTQYDLTVGQYIYGSERIRAHEGSYLEP